MAPLSPASTARAMCRSPPPGDKLLLIISVTTSSAFDCSGRVKPMKSGNDSRALPPGGHSHAEVDRCRQELACEDAGANIRGTGRKVAAGAATAGGIPAGRTAKGNERRQTRG